MKFILSTHFRRTDFNGTTLYIAGRPSMSDDSIYEKFNSSGSLEELRGQFALVISQYGEIVHAQVDHLCTFPLYYTDLHMGGIFEDVASTMHPRQPDRQLSAIIVLLGGQSIGPRTTIQGVFRIPPGTILKVKKSFNDTKSIETTEYHRPWTAMPKNGQPRFEVCETLERVIVEKVLQSDDHLLLLSAGRDSVTIAAILRKHSILSKVRMVHVYSNIQGLTERHYVEMIAKEMNLKVEYYRCDTSGNFDAPGDERFRGFWVENPFSAKRQAAQHFSQPGTIVWTGEIGDQIFGGPKNDIIMRYAVQTTDPMPETMADIWINQAMTFGRSNSISPDPALVKFIASSSFHRAGYEETKKFLVDTLRALKGHDALSALMRLNFIVKGPYRMWAYSQSEQTYWTPFSDYRVVEAAFATPVNLLVGSRGTAKLILLEFLKEFISDLPWRISKHGFGVPEKQFIRRSN